MSDKETGGPAFSSGVACMLQDDGKRRSSDVLTLRDYFAARAMAGELASSTLIWTDNVFELTAENAYKFADAMLSERNK